jgi:hypothetical protein
MTDFRPVWTVSGGLAAGSLAGLFQALNDHQDGWIQVSEAAFVMGLCLTVAFLVVDIQFQDPRRPARFVERPRVRLPLAWTSWALPPVGFVALLGHTGLWLAVLFAISAFLALLLVLWDVDVHYTGDRPESTG